jgi:hypothetical protein
MPRELTKDEVRDRLIRHVWGVINWWEAESRVKSTRGKLEGVAFSILAALDGSAADMPGFSVAPQPHESDMQYCKDHGEDWFPPPTDVPNDVCGSLHERFYEYAREHGIKISPSEPTCHPPNS